MSHPFLVGPPEGQGTLAGTVHATADCLLYPTDDVMHNRIALWHTISSQPPGSLVPLPHPLRVYKDWSEGPWAGNGVVLPQVPGAPGLFTASVRVKLTNPTWRFVPGRCLICEGEGSCKATVEVDGFNRVGDLVAMSEKNGGSLLAQVVSFFNKLG